MKKKNSTKKGSRQISKSFKRRKRKKIRQYHHECNKNLSEEQKQNKAEYMRNYYIRNNF